MMRKVQRLGSQTGYSTLEMLVVVGIMGVVAAMAAWQIGAARPGFKGDGAMRQVVAQLNIARERAITERRNMRVAFTPANEITTTRQEVNNAGVATATTLLTTVPIEGGMRYGLTATVPDTPDAFGNATSIDFGIATQYWFTTDGTLTDQNAAPISGTIFLTMPGQVRAARAVTILGATGRIRGYRWDGRAWVRI